MLTAWQRTDGRAVWCVGELCVPGMLSADKGVSFLSLLIQDSSFAEEKSARNDVFGRWTAVNSKRGLAERGVRTVERSEGVGVSTLYRWPSTSKVNRKISFKFGCISVVFVSKAPIEMEVSW